MIEKKDLTGVVLAGGQSSRFGSNKATYVCPNGESFLMRAIELLRPLCSEVVISGNKEAYASCGCRQIKDQYEDCGPLSGIHATLKACSTDYALFLTCDMPLMKTAPLLCMFAEPLAPVIGWQSQAMGGGIFPLLISTSLLDDIEQALEDGNHSIRHSICATAHAHMLTIPNIWKPLFANINQKDDLNTIFT